MKRIGPAWLLCATLLLQYCGETAISGNGGSSETVNAKVIITDTTVTVTIDDSDNSELSMRIFSTEYRPYEKRGFADSAVSTDANSVRWQAPAAGNYNLILTVPTKGIACFVHDIQLNRGSDDTVDCALAPVGILTGSIVSTDNPMDSEPYLVAIRGSPFFGLSDTSGSFSINAVPSSNYSISVRSTAKRLFVASASYSITTEMFNQSTRLRVMIP